VGDTGDPRTKWRSAFRGIAAPAEAVQPPAVRSPVGAVNSQTVAGQYGLSAGAGSAASRIQPGGSQPYGAAQEAAALRQQAAPPTEAAWEQLGQSSQGQQLQQLLRQGYAGGGLGGIQQAVEGTGQDWYEMPEYVRTQILAGARQPETGGK
jgi:hypothetical protein